MSMKNYENLCYNDYRVTTTYHARSDMYRIRGKFKVRGVRGQVPWINPKGQTRWRRPMSRYPELWSIPTSTLLTSKLTPHFTSPPHPTLLSTANTNSIYVLCFISEAYLMVVTVGSFDLS